MSYKRRQNAMKRYFDEHYSQYEDTVEFWNDPAMNQWLFDIPELKLRVELTCIENGNVEECIFNKEI